MVAAGITALVLALPLYPAWKIANVPMVRGADPLEAAPAATGGLLLSLVTPKVYAATGAIHASRSIVPEDPRLDTILRIAVLIGLSHAVTGRNLHWSFAGLLIASARFTVVRRAQTHEP